MAGQGEWGGFAAFAGVLEIVGSLCYGVAEKICAV